MVDEGFSRMPTFSRVLRLFISCGNVLIWMPCKKMDRSAVRKKWFILGVLQTVLLWIGLFFIWTWLPLLTGHMSTNKGISKVDRCPTKIVVSIDNGRLGNKFFQYLAARFLADALESDIFITPVFAELYDRYFIGRQTPIIDWNYLENRCSIPPSEFVTVPVNYLPELEAFPNITHKYMKVTGYPVDLTSTIWSAIYTNREALLPEFQWRSELKNVVHNKLAEIKAKYKSQTIVGVHARRTDYYIYLVAYYDTFHAANASYYLAAMNHCRKKYENPVFLIFSDDMRWCRENLKGNDIEYAGRELVLKCYDAGNHNRICLYIGTGNQTDPGLDLAMMSSCDHLILSYGTYGMVAAWFNGYGDIIAADNFTGKPEAMVQTLKSVPVLAWQWMSV